VPVPVVVDDCLAQLVVPVQVGQAAGVRAQDLLVGGRQRNRRPAVGASPFRSMACEITYDWKALLRRPDAFEDIILDVAHLVLYCFGQVAVVNEHAKFQVDVLRTPGEVRAGDE
jgi:hypothetical protein